MDPTTELVVPFIQILFYGGLIVVMIGLPMFIWLWIRLMRDVHSIAESLHWISHCTKPQDAAANPAVPAEVKLSAFGR